MRLASGGQQVVGGQAQGRANGDDESLLRLAKRGVKPMRAVGAVGDIVAPLPLADGQPTDVVALGKLALRERGAADFLAHQVGGAGLAVQGLAHDVGFLCCAKSVIRRSRHLHSGQLRIGI